MFGRFGRARLCVCVCTRNMERWKTKSQHNEMEKKKTKEQLESGEEKKI